ncbi:MAG: response regulator [Spirochaetia bacterium]|nr:response regulator [Spirochaetia bacterium]
MRKVKVLLVEDEAIVAKHMKILIEKAGHDVVSIVSKGEEAVKKAEEIKPDIILMDIQLKGKMNGIEAAETINNLFHVPVVFATAHSDENHLEKAGLVHPYGYLVKPIHERDLLITLKMALHSSKLDAEKREIQDKLLAKEEQLQLTLNSLDDFLFSFDKNGILIDYYKPKHSSFFNLPETGIGISYKEVLPPEMSKKAEEALDNFKPGISIQHFEFMQLEGETEYWFDVKISSRIRNNNEYDGITGLVREISSRKQIEKILIKAKKQAEIAIENKIDFIADMSQELKIAFNEIMGFIHVIENQTLTNLNDEQKECFTLMKEKINSLLLMIDDVQQLSDAGNGAVKLIEGKDDSTHKKRLNRYKQFGKVGKFLPPDMESLLGALEEIIELNSKTSDI